MARVLLVEDEAAIAQTVEYALRADGFETAHALTGHEALQLAQLAVDLAPFYGSSESLAQIISGRSSVSAEEANRFWAAVGVIPVAGGVLRHVGEPSVDALAAIFRGGEATKTAAGASDVARAPSAASPRCPRATARAGRRTPAPACRRAARPGRCSRCCGRRCAAACRS